MISKLLKEAHDKLGSAVNTFEMQLSGQIGAFGMEDRVIHNMGNLCESLGILKALLAMSQDIEEPCE